MNHAHFYNTLGKSFHKLHTAFEQIPLDESTETMVEMFVLCSMELSLAILSKEACPVERINMDLDILKESIETLDKALRPGNTAA